MILPGFPMPLIGRAGVEPVIASFSQSSNYGGTGVQAATVANMSDGLFEPFAATDFAGEQFVRAHLEQLAFVDTIILGPSTTTGGWGSGFLNNRLLQYSNDGGSSWTTIRTLSGYVNPTNSTTGTMREEAIGVECTDLRIASTGGNIYIAVSEFKLKP